MKKAKKAKKALATLAIAGMILSMGPVNAVASDPVTIRLAGNTTVQTAKAIVEDGWTASAYAVIAPVTVYNMADTLSGAPLAAVLQAPVLLTGGDQLSTEAKDEIQRLGIKTVYVTSGQAVIKAGVIADLKDLGVQVNNLGGFDQYETSVNIAKEIAKVSPTTAIFIANGEAAQVAQDALSVASLAGAQKQPLLLTQKGQLPKVVADYIASIKAKVTNSYIIGGTGVVSADIEKQLPGTVSRNWGQDAYDTNLAVLKNFTTFDFKRVFVANGETMIDALAGAPLAARTSAPIVLVSGSVTTAMTDHLKGKVNYRTVVTALGGTAVVPENLRTILAKPGELKVTSVEGATSEVYTSDEDQNIEISVGGVVKSLDELKAAGYSVEFQATEAVFPGEEYDSTEGILDAERLGNFDEFNYIITILKSDSVVATSESKHVKVKPVEKGTTGIDTAKIFLADSNGTISASPVEIKSGQLTLDDNAYLRVMGTNANDEYGSITTEVEVSSTDPSIVYVDKRDILNQGENVYAKIVTGGHEGTATITVTTSDGIKKTINLTVKDETRKVIASKTVVNKSVPIKISKGATQDFLVTVKDQYGDCMKGYELILKNATSGSDEIASAQLLRYVITQPTGTDGSEGITDKNGRVVVRVTGGEDTGSGNIKINDQDSNTLGTVLVTNSESAGYAAEYSLNTVPNKTTTLDCSDTNAYVTYLSVDGHDNLGYKIKAEDDIEELTVKVAGNKIENDQEDTQNSSVIVTYDSATKIIKVVGKKVKSDPVKIAVYYGNSKRELASTSITVGDTRAKVTEVTFENNISTISGTSGIKLDKILDKSGVKTDDGNPVTFKLLDDGCVNIIGVDETIIGNLRLNVIEGDITPSFNDDSGDLKIAVDGENESGKIRLTVNKLSGRTSAEDDTPTNATKVTDVTITCEDLVAS